MRFRRRTIFFLLMLSPVWLSGCNRSHARPAPPRRSPGKVSNLSTPVAKHPQRDSALATYRNLEYGVGFRYPRNFELQEEFEPGSTESLERLTGQQSGAIPVAAVLISNDAYPNTTFRGATLQFVVNPMVPPEECQSFAVPSHPDPRDSAGASTISGILFHWRQSGDFASPMNYSTRVYTAFFHSACYEFYLEVTDSVSMVPDPGEKPADTARILHHLEKIVSSLQIHPPAPAALPKPAPSVHDVDVDSLAHPNFHNMRASPGIFPASPKTEFFCRG